MCSVFHTERVLSGAYWFHSAWCHSPWNRLAADFLYKIFHIRTHKRTFHALHSTAAVLFHLIQLNSPAIAQIIQSGKFIVTFYYLFSYPFEARKSSRMNAKRERNVKHFNTHQNCFAINSGWIVNWCISDGFTHRFFFLSCNLSLEIYCKFDYIIL